jgi:hypothetical protein
MLKDIFRVLKNGGKLTLFTDNAGWWGWHTPFQNLHYGSYETERAHDPGDRHYALYTPGHVRAHLEKAGFSSIKVDYDMVVEEGKNERMWVRLVSRALFYIPLLKKIAYPHIKATAVKINNRK